MAHVVLRIFRRDLWFVMLRFGSELGALDLFLLWMILEHGAAEFHLFLLAFTVEEDLVKRVRAHADLADGLMRVANTLSEAGLFNAKFLDYRSGCDIR